MTEVWLAYTQYGEDIVGAFSTEEKAKGSLTGKCTNVQDHLHPDGYRCGVWKMTVDSQEKDQ